MKLTKSDIELFIHSNNEFLECCDEELEQVVGGRKYNYSYYCCQY